MTVNKKKKHQYFPENDRLLNFIFRVEMFFKPKEHKKLLNFIRRLESIDINNEHKKRRQ